MLRWRCKHKMARFIWPLAIFLVIAVLLGRGLSLDPKKVPSPLIDKPIPKFQLTVLDNPGAQISDKDLMGKVSVVNVWASWCVACRDEHDVLQRLAKMGVVDIYGINHKDKREDALEWLAQLGDPYLVSMFDDKGRVSIDWGVYGVPETFVVDKQGIIRHKVIGPVTDNLVREEILPLLRELKAAGS